MPATLGRTAAVTHVLRGHALDTSGQTVSVSGDPDGRRSAASALLLVRLGEERGVPATTSLAGTDLGVDDLRRPGAEVDDAEYI